MSDDSPSYEYEDEDEDEFNNIVDALVRPAPPPPSATLRVADLYCGDGELGQAAEDAGLDVVYRREPESPTEYLDFKRIPPFDFLTASMPDTDDGRGEAVDFVLRFLRVRRPAAFLLMGKDLNGSGEGFLVFVRGKTRRLGYRVNNAGLNGGKGKGAGHHTGQNGDGHAFVVGALGVNPFVTLPADDEEPAALGAGATGSGGARRGPPALPPAVQSAIEQIVRNLG